MVDEITKQILLIFEAHRAERTSFIDKTFQKALNDLNRRNMLFSSIAAEKFAGLFSDELSWRVDNAWSLIKKYFNKNDLQFKSSDLEIIYAEIDNCIQNESDDLSNHAKRLLQNRKDMDYQSKIDHALNINRNNLNSKLNGELNLFKQLKSTQNNCIGNNTVFISYSHIDSEVADDIAAILEEFEITFFRDVKDIEWGQPISLKVKEGLNDSLAILVIVSPASLKSHWVPYEIGYATAKEKRILPYLTHPSLEVPSYIKDLNYKADLSKVKDFFSKYSFPKVTDLLIEMKKDIEGDGSKVVREFVVLPNDRVLFNSSKRRFTYFENEHSELQNKIDLLEEAKLISLVSTSNTPIYRFSDYFVNLLCQSELNT
jgi:hypothetical protein